MPELKPPPGPHHYVDAIFESAPQTSTPIRRAKVTRIGEPSYQLTRAGHEVMRAAQLAGAVIVSKGKFVEGDTHADR